MDARRLLPFDGRGTLLSKACSSVLERERLRAHVAALVIPEVAVLPPAETPTASSVVLSYGGSVFATIGFL